MANPCPLNPTQVATALKDSSKLAEDHYNALLHYLQGTGRPYRAFHAFLGNGTGNPRVFSTGPIPVPVPVPSSTPTPQPEGFQHGSWGLRVFRGGKQPFPLTKHNFKKNYT